MRQWRIVLNVPRPTVIDTANTLTDGVVGARIAELSASRHTYDSIAQTVSDEYGIQVSRDSVRRWLIAEGLVAARKAAGAAS